MTTYEIAEALIRQGFAVFPLKQDGKPYTENGFKNAVSSEEDLAAIWRDDALIGVYTGASGIIVLDLDMKVSPEGDVLVDGFTSLDEAWLDVPETFAYDSRNGLGRHLVYLAPEGKNLPRQMGYRGMKGVDRCSGQGYVAWMGGVPQPGEMAEAPEWLLDEKKVREKHNYQGDVSNWFEGLVPGAPNALVRKAMERAQERFEEFGNDFNHGQMVELQFNFVRLGAEGNPGVPEALEFLEELFHSRQDVHSRTPDEWDEEWQEALHSAVDQYGDAIALLKDLPEYSIGLVPKGISDSLVTTPGGKAEFSRLLGELVKETQDDNRILSVLWNCPATKDLARDWGLEFTAKRIEDARVRPEPTRENPRIEEKRAAESEGKDTDLKLLTDEERAWLATRPTFVDHVEQYAVQSGYDQLSYFRATGWNMLSLAMGLRGYIPVSATHRFGVNLWQIIMGYSGTGKSISDNFQTQVLDLVMSDDLETPYDLGADSSIQGLHLALLQRDNVPSLFTADEASGWFKRLKSNDWTTGLEDSLSDWYLGRVSPSNKISLKELRGKSATTSLCMLMYATPDRLAETLTLDQFLSGFLARVMWTYGNPRVETDEMFDIFKDSAGEVQDVETAPKVVRDIAADLVTARAHFRTPVALQPTAEAKERIAEAYRKLYKTLQSEKNWNILEPAVTRHAEVIIKVAGLCAMYRGASTIEVGDVLHAVKQVEEWAKNLVRVAEHITVGEFQQRCAEAEAYIRQLGGSATATKIYHRFGSWIVRDAKEIDNVLVYMVSSGILNREEASGGLRYTLNGSEE